MIRNTVRHPPANHVVYLRFECGLDFPAIGMRLEPGSSAESVEHDSENVYEWMWIRIPNVPCLLNVSREHGWADLDDSLLAFDSEVLEDELLSMVKPGPVYINGWDAGRDRRVGTLPDWLPQHIADQLTVEVHVFSGDLNVDHPDPDPVRVVKPQHHYGQSAKT